MATKTIDLGAVSAYAVAVKNGFTGTEAEWEQYIANASKNAQDAQKYAADAKANADRAATVTEGFEEKAEQALSAVENAGSTAMQTIVAEGATQKKVVTDAGDEQARKLYGTFETLDAALTSSGTELKQAIETSGSGYVESIASEGSAQMRSISSTGTIQKQAVEAVGQTQTQKVEAAGTTQTTAVTEAGAAQVKEVQDAGAAKVQAIETAGNTQKQAVESAGATQVTNVTEAGEAQVKAVKDKTDEQIKRIPQVMELAEDVASLKDDISNHGNRITALNDVVFSKEEQHTETVEVDYSERFDCREEYGYIRKDGSFTQNNSFVTSLIVPVQPGDIVNFYRTDYGSPVSVRYYAFYKDGDPTGQGGNTVSVYNLEIPADVDGIVASTVKGSSYDYNAYKMEVVGKRTQTIIITEKTKGIKDKVDDMLVAQPYPLSWAGDLPAGEACVLEPEGVWINKTWVATARVSGEFGGFAIGAYDGAKMVTPYIEVTPTQVITHSHTDAMWDKTWNHGLTIANDVSIVFEQRMNFNCHRIIIQSNGEMWTAPETARMGEHTNPIALKTVSALADVSFAVGIKDLMRDVWVCGDSWTSLYDTRWVGQAHALGYNNWLHSGFAGGQTWDGFVKLKTLLSIRKPKTLVWCYGMNDGDISNDAPNTNWKKAYDELTAICDEFGIELILYTVPTTKTINNNAKNAVVRASGRRYVDAVKAMGADESGNWIPGYVSSDGNHTSVEGAKALLMRFMADAPELFFD